MECSVETDYVRRVALVKDPGQGNQDLRWWDDDITDDPYGYSDHHDEDQADQPPELGDDLLLDGRLHLQVDHLLGDDGAGGLVLHAVHHLVVVVVVAVLVEFVAIVGVVIMVVVKRW